MSSQQQLYQIADELRAIASLGLIFTEGGYDKERYEQVLKASARIIATIDDASAEEIYTKFHDNLFHVSPILAVEAVVIREGQILLIQRRDNQLWALPGGLAEVGETPVGAAERELWEEAGIHGQTTRLLGIFDSRMWNGRTRMHLYTAMFQLETDETPCVHPPEDGALSAFHETLSAGFFAADHLPVLSPGHDRKVPMVFKLLCGEVPIPFFDR